MVATKAGLALLLWVALSASEVPAQSRATSPVLDAMRTELARSLATFKGQPTAPYFLSYEISEAHTLNVAGSFGAVTQSSERRHRALDVDLRVGDYRFDNTHPLRGGFPGRAFMGFDGMAEIPVDDDPGAIRAALWYATDRRYKRAVEQLTWVKTNAAVGVAAEDTAPDFSAEPREGYTEPVAAIGADARAWEDKIRRYTAPFARYGDIYEAEAVFIAEVDTRWYVNSEGTELQTSQPIYRLYISAFSKADDGMELPRYESFWAFAPTGLPSDRVVLAAVQRMIDDLHALRRAPPLEPYTGPAILSGRASAVFFHEVFGHRVEGHRQKLEIEGQTFKKKVNEAVLPPAFSVSFDPTLRRLGGTELAGFYRYDDEGVKARRVTVVDHGILKTFLMARSPIEGFAASNGHGRAQLGLAPVARQSNLVVETTEPHSQAELKRMLIDEIKRENKPYGLLFDDIEGGFTITMRFIPNAFNVMPVMVYRVYPDGREELVRGVDFIGTPLTTFSKIVAADDQVAVFNGMCGAESGWVPVSAVSPGLLVSQVEVQKKLKSQERPPILPPPIGTAATP
jgi:predicted Zn-dependent protease